MLKCLVDWEDGLLWKGILCTGLLVCTCLRFVFKFI